MRIGLCDADLLDTRRRHKFPNLALMKLSAYYAAQGHNTELVSCHEFVYQPDIFKGPYDKVFLSKVFSDTVVPQLVLDHSSVEIGGTGFFFDKAENLPDEIEHHSPDYHLYDRWYQQQLSVWSPNQIRYYADYSIGFTTRGCTRRCQFCVNRNSTGVVRHSPVSEFLDPTRKYISLWDDNILVFPQWEEVFNELQATGKEFEFKQGMDFRAMTERKAEVISTVNYHRDYLFAFDNIADKDLIVRKLEDMWLKYRHLRTRKNKTRFFVLVGFDREGRYDEAFWQKDMKEALERVRILADHDCLSYIMRYDRCKDSPYCWFYQALSMWCNQINIFCCKSIVQVHEQKGRRRNDSKMEKMLEQKWFRDMAEVTGIQLGCSACLKNDGCNLQNGTGNDEDDSYDDTNTDSGTFSV